MYHCAFWSGAARLNLACPLLCRNSQAARYAVIVAGGSWREDRGRCREQPSSSASGIFYSREAVFDRLKNMLRITPSRNSTKCTRAARM